MSIKYPQYRVSQWIDTGPDDAVMTTAAHYYRHRKEALLCDQLRIMRKSLADPPPRHRAAGYIDMRGES